MFHRRLIVAATLALASTGSSSQQHHGHPQLHSDYAELRNRDIKALSSLQIEDLRAGKGMGLSLPAELNRTPGPMHALEMQSELGLTPEQAEKLATLLSTMRAEAIELGNAVIEAERKLDQAFASGVANASFVENQAAGIGLLNGKLRAVHLKAHLTATGILTAAQIARYQELRGYTQ